MAVYTVGPSGATVVNRQGLPLCRLAPGSIVIPGLVASQEDAVAYLSDARDDRRAGYRDAKLRPAADTHEPSS